MATTVTKQIGRVPVNRGEWVSGTAYHLQNIVSHNGSSFIAVTEGVTAEPTATYSGGEWVVTSGWQLLSYGSELSDLTEQVAVSAETDVEHQAEVEGIQEQLRTGQFGDIKPTSCSVDSETGFQVKGQSLIIEGDGAPAKAPAFAGQIYIDTTNNIAYICCTSYTGDSDFGTTNDWKCITNA